MKEELFTNRPMRILAAFLLFMLLLALGSYASLNFERLKYVDATPATISVSGKGEALAKPDVGQFTFSVMAEADSAAAAQEQSGVKINEILAYLKEQGVAEEDIKTLYYNLDPRWRYEERECVSMVACPPGERVQDGFAVNQTIEVKIRNTESAGSLLVGVGDLGATNISGLDFTVDDMDAIQAQARELAIKDAQEKAAILARQLGVRIVRLANYYEQNNGYQPYMMERSMSADTGLGGGFGGAEIPIGQESNTVTVQLEYEVQ